MGFDAIVVGSGISGGWAAKELCERGLKVLMLERGPHIEHGADYSHDLAAQLRRREDQVPAEELELHHPYYPGVSYALFNSNRKFWASDHDHPYETAPGKPYRWIRGYHLGGRSITWWRQSYRLAPQDFESNLKDGHGVDWPIRYEDLAPWYDHVEAFAGVSGDYDEIDHLPDGDFLPPYPMNVVEEAAKGAIEAAFPGRRMIIGRAAQLSRVTKIHQDLGRGRCEQRMRCVHGCPLGGYFSTLAATLPAAQKTGNLTVMTDTIVAGVDYDPAAGRATGVRTVDRVGKAGRTFQAKIIFLNASTIASAAILLNSRSEAHPRGLANGSDQVGRNLMDHVSCESITGRYPGFEDVHDPADRPTGVYIPRYAQITEGEKPYLRGFGLQGGAGRTRRIEARAMGGAEREEAGGGKPWSMALTPFGEVLPCAENRVTLSASRTDQWGVPVPVIDAAHGRNEQVMMREAARDAYEMLKAAGCVDITPWEAAGEKITPPGDRIHEMGTARMGRDPATSVLNGWSQAHEVPNLFITDGAAMTSSASMNPSLTYMALSARAANRAADLLRDGAL
ncbi:GMC oxidoreductase [Phenylobacterium sp.]|uniref:GMC oxidoreductase n=1 Tax=Phenylobacterium sp. TaxID=1871053 RepID=UPI00272FEF79|nr:GMC family oxidoreductase [Phenylobacterium sp.]MDP1873978.1 GMC family oxidoreductase [Phenylobacterium sp.]MDP3488799.1 GMC family oxidoreductase [Phenylobacterium sp.]